MSQRGSALLKFALLILVTKSQTFSASRKSTAALSPRSSSIPNALGPVPGVDVMAKRSQGLLKPMWGLFPAGSWLSQRSSAGVAREGALFFSPASRGALWAAPGLFGCNVQLGGRAAPPAPRGRCSGQPRSK
jgi:hypothetical protein